MNIKEFLGSNPLESVTKDAETAGKLAVEAVGWKLKTPHPNYEYRYLSANESLRAVDRQYWRRCDELSSDLNAIAHLESAVIEKVGDVDYIYALAEVFGTDSLRRKSAWETQQIVVKLTRATAAQRLTAILLALSEVE